jgi:hypothetical protein
MPRVKTSWAPGQPLPRNADRRTLAAIISHEFFPISHRTIERWPLVVRRVNGHAITKTSDGLTIAENKLSKARSYKLGSGRAPPSKQKPTAA